MSKCRKGVTYTLSRRNTERWEDSGPDGEAFRAHMRNILADRARVEVRSYDGITLDAWSKTDGVAENK